MRKFNHVGKLFIAAVAMVMSFNVHLCFAAFWPPEKPVGYTYNTGGGYTLKVNDKDGLTLVDATNLKPNPNGSYSVSFLSSPYSKSEEGGYFMYVTDIEPHAFDGFNQRFIDAGQEPPEVRVPSEALSYSKGPFPSNIVGD